jgi:hypothetical protein
MADPPTTLAQPTGTSHEAQLSNAPASTTQRRTPAHAARCALALAAALLARLSALPTPHAPPAQAQPTPQKNSRLARSAACVSCVSCGPRHGPYRARSALPRSPAASRTAAGAPSGADLARLGPAVRSASSSSLAAWKTCEGRHGRAAWHAQHAVQPRREPGTLRS